MITANQLNAIAKLIGTEDKSIVISMAIKTLCESGMKPSEAFDAVFGQGSFASFAGDIHAALSN
jgi:hypothetical protein